MGLKCGLIGLPNVGKSTLFNTLTKSHIAAENFPFCTIEPNIGILSVPDNRLDQIALIVKPQRIVPTTIEFVDTAGLVKNASQGEGLGNHFLTKIREVEVIVHVVRCFEDDTIMHINGKINPVSDINIINTELILSDIEICERAIIRVQKRIKSNDQSAQLELVLLKKCLKYLSDVGMLRTLNLSNTEKSTIRYLNFITLKPIMYIANINKYNLNDNSYLDQVRSFASAEETRLIIVCATMKSELTELELMKLGIQQQEYGLNNVIQAGYQLLNLQTYFTAGNKEVRAWTIPIGTTALQAASKIHTDFAKGFIRAQTISFNDFITFQGEKGAKKAGKIHFEGKEYIVKDGDVINFLFNV